ncbi:predicted protein [Histoplasma capsulatum var. duboisii H88]|uniref:Predicted protein n=1 Tax=Ajellomyces capsulatus (strain H88) TaxID=544711 RepID=F0UV34_AJEC8|nr:predicted protein [Histoplasma capsulatum var. duboisii H88]
MLSARNGARQAGVEASHQPAKKTSRLSRASRTVVTNAILRAMHCRSNSGMISTRWRIVLKVVPKLPNWPYKKYERQQRNVLTMGVVSDILDIVAASTFYSTGHIDRVPLEAGRLLFSALGFIGLMGLRVAPVSL